MGTHPIFESDFDCLTEGNDERSKSKCRDDGEEGTTIYCPGCPEEKYADKSTCYKFDIFIWWCNEWHPRIVWMERLFPLFYLCRVPDRALTNEVGIQLDQVLSRLLKPHQRISNSLEIIRAHVDVLLWTYTHLLDKFCKSASFYVID